MGIPTCNFDIVAVFCTCFRFFRAATITPQASRSAGQGAAVTGSGAAQKDALEAARRRVLQAASVVEDLLEPASDEALEAEAGVAAKDGFAT